MEKKTTEELVGMKTPSFVPSNYREVCDKLLADLDKDYERTLAARIPEESEYKTLPEDDEVLIIPIIVW